MKSCFFKRMFINNSFFYNEDRRERPKCADLGCRDEPPFDTSVFDQISDAQSAATHSALIYPQTLHYKT